MEKHKAVFYGKVFHKEYYCRRSGGHPISFPIPIIDYRFDLIEEREFYKCHLDSPVLSVGEEVYVNELDITTKVYKVVRSTAGYYMYFTEHELEVIEDDKTKESLEYAEKTAREILEYQERREEEAMEIEKEREQQKHTMAKSKKKWWQLFK